MDDFSDPRQFDAYQFFISRGWSPAQASGIVGALQGETNNLNTRQVHDNGIGLGISGWNGDRLSGLYQFAKQNNADPLALPTQLQYVDYELRNNEGAAGKLLSQATNPAQAGQAMLSYFRPAGWDQPGAHPERAQLAQKAYTQFSQMADASDQIAKSLGISLSDQGSSAPPSAPPPAATSASSDDIAKSLGVTLSSGAQAPASPDIIPGSAAAGIPTKITIRPSPWASPDYQSGVQAQVVQGMPIVGPLFNKLEAAAAATAEPAINPLRNVLGEPPIPMTGQTWGDRYAANLADIEKQRGQFAQENPLASTGANIVGGGLATIPLGATALGGRALGLVGSSLGSRVYQSIAGGAGINALDAYLRGDSPLVGAEVGAAGGPIGVLGGEALHRGISTIMSRYLPPPGPLQNINPVARDFLLSALEGESPSSLAAGMERMGPRGFLGDINTGLTDIAGGLADIPGPQKGLVREAYRQRAAGQPQAIENAVRQAFGPKTDILQYQNFLTEARKAAADPLYEQFRSTQVHPTDELKSLIPRLEKAGAFDQAEKLSGITGEPINKNFFTGGPQKEFPTTQTWDYVKRGLDSKIDQAYSAGDKTLARSLVGLRNDLISEIEKTNAGQIWKQARMEFADRSAIMDQLQAGQDTFLGGRSGISANELREELKGLSGPELQARIMGARDAIDQAMGATRIGDTSLRNKLLAPNNVEKLELLLGKPKADQLVKTLKQEEFLSDQTKNVIGGSPTAPKTARINALQPPPTAHWSPKLTEPLSFIPPSWVEALRPSTILEGARQQRYANAYNQLAPVLLSHGPQINDLVSAIGNEMARRQAAGALASRLGSALTGAFSGVGVPTARRELNFQTQNPLAVGRAY